MTNVSLHYQFLVKIKMELNTEIGSVGYLLEAQNLYVSLWIGLLIASKQII